jgi:predicted AAA+ superfamily ATPase
MCQDAQMNEFLDSTAVRQVLQGFNPWWSRKPDELPPFRRLAFEVCRRHLTDKALRRAVLLSGPRRVGKTTILLQIAQELVNDLDPLSVFYISLDHPILKLVPLHEILRIYHQDIYPEGKPVVLLMDEIQYSNDWDLYVKHLVDHQPSYRVLATGSASVVHRQELAESGVGRWIRVPVPTLSFYEFLHLRGESLKRIPRQVAPRDLLKADHRRLVSIAARLRPVQPLFLRYLLVGGFPETVAAADVPFCQRILREDVVERVLKRDMTALFNVRNVNDLERLFIYLCLHSGGIFEVQTAAKALATPRSTVNNYLDLLEQANLIYRLPPTDLGGKKVLKAKHKVYLVDAALRNAVLLRGEEVLNDPNELGIIVETTVLRHLVSYYYLDTPRLCYWRETATNREVDVIVQSPNYVIPVEVKYRNHAAVTEDSGLVRFCRTEQSIRQAYLVTKNEADFSIAQVAGCQAKILRVPAHVFCFLLGQAERLLWKVDAAESSDSSVSG